MNGYRLRVWVGRDGIMFVSCASGIPWDPRVHDISR